MSTIESPRITLTSHYDWDNFYSFVRTVAKGENVWQYIDLEQDDEQLPVKLIPPVRPVELADLAAIQNKHAGIIQAYQFLQDEFLRQERGLANVRIQIGQSTGTAYKAVIQEKDDPREALQALKQAIKPGQAITNHNLEREYLSLKQGPRDKTMSSWTARWRNLARRIEARKKDEPFPLSNDLLVRGFIEGVLTVNESWAGPQFTYHDNCGAVNQKRLSVIVDEFDRYNTVVESTRQGTKRRHAAVFAATLGTGEQDEKTEKRAREPREDSSRQKRQKQPKCVCDNDHSWAKCWYLNKDGLQRPSWAILAEATIQRIIKALSSNVNLRNRVERALGHAYDRFLQKDTPASKKQSQEAATGQERGPQPPAKPSSPNEQTDDDPDAYFIYGTDDFTVAYTQAQQDEPSRNHFIVDSGATIHVTNDKNRLTGFTPLNPGKKIRHGDAFSAIVGYGKLRLVGTEAYGSMEVELRPVAYVPGFHLNIISLSRLKSDGVTWDPEEGVLYNIATRARLTSTSPTKTGLWVFDEGDELKRPSVNVVTIPDRLDPRAREIWHRRLGHAYNRAIDKLPESTQGSKIATEKLQGLAIPPVCDTCLKANAK
jgi:hypothetical protein